MISPRRIFIALIALTLTACAAQTRLSSHTRKEIMRDYGGRLVELRQSLYFGDLYDENEKWLLSPYPFEHTSHIVDFEGNPINPRRQKGIIPAGTAFVIEKIEFPDTITLAKRMLTSPRFNPWVYLRPTPNSELQDLHPENKPYILPLPVNMESGEEVQAALARLLAESGAMLEWLSQRRPTIRVAIRQKEILTGMSRDELIAAMGEPYRWFSQMNNSQQTLVAWYPAKEAWREKGKVTRIDAPREIQQPPLPDEGLKN